MLPLLISEYIVWRLYDFIYLFLFKPLRYYLSKNNDNYKLI
jgi:hypothetical protein